MFPPQYIVTPITLLDDFGTATHLCRRLQKLHTRIQLSKYNFALRSMANSFPPMPIAGSVSLLPVSKLYYHNPALAAMI
jgi:hypothetical protein